MVYPGADGEFVLYEDEGNNYNFENGAYATTTACQWKDAAGQLLNIGEREGSFPGMREAVYADGDYKIGYGSGAVGKIYGCRDEIEAVFTEAPDGCARWKCGCFRGRTMENLAECGDED